MFQHEAMFYAGREAFVAGITAFIREGLAAGEPTMVMVTADKIDDLRAELGDDADGVEFADMGTVGRNPARIIPAWREFAAAHEGPGRRMRGVGEPIWAGRSPAELLECQHHESLLNLAFAETRDFELICPYDTESLPEEVLDEARRSHPAVMVDGGLGTSPVYRGHDRAAVLFSEGLPEPRGPRHVLPFARETLARVRDFTARHAARAGLAEQRKDDVVLAVNEVATNSVVHGGGQGQLRTWREPGALVFEVRDGGYVAEPLVGRVRPALGQIGGHGLWLVNNVCELVQLRSSEAGTVVRLHVAA